MSSADPREVDRASVLIERLLADADFRAAFRRDPVTACQAAGLEGLAAEFGSGGPGMQTLELRESKSSLAGVVMAVAAEGVAVAELQGLLHGHGLGAHGRAAELKALRAAHVKVPHGAVARVAEHQLKAHAGAGGAGTPGSGASAGGASAGGASAGGASSSAGAASSGAAPSSGGASSSGAAAASAASPGSGGASSPGGSSAAPSPAGPSGASAMASTAAAPGGHAGAAGGHADAAAAGAQKASAGGGAAGATAYQPGGRQSGGSQYVPSGSGTVTPQPGTAGGAAAAAGSVPASGAAPAGGAVSAAGSAPAGGAAPAAGAVVASAGAPSGGAAATVAELLQNPRLAMAPQARALLATGSADPRLLGILSTTLQHHTIAIGDIEAITDPVHAQAIDITAVDGQPIDASNVAARDLITEIAALDPSTRPNEIGTPWPIQSPGFFTDATHQNRLHLAFTSPADYQPGVAAAAAGATPAAVGAAAAGVTPAAAGAAAAINPAAAGAAPSSGPTPIDPAAAGAAQAAQQALSTPPPPPPPTPQPPAVPSAAPVPQTPVAQQPGAGQQILDVAQHAAPQAGGAANAKIRAMTAMADSLLGKPYVLGGGHSGWAPQAGYDCSGFVSRVLHAGGYLSAPVDTTALPSQPGILSGPGKLVTIYDRAQPGENGHVIIEINGQFYESGGMHGPWGGGGGVEKIGRPSASYLATFERVLHPSGL